MDFSPQSKEIFQELLPIHPRISRIRLKNMKFTFEKI